MRYLTALLAAALLSGLPACAAFAAQAPETTVGIRLVDVPADSADDPRARSYIVDHMNPGANITRDVEVQNKSSHPTTVSVYTGAAEIVDGQFTVSDEGNHNDLSNWTSVPEPTISMAAGESAVVPVTISVPSDAPEGEQYAAIWAQVQGTDDAALQVSRVGIREYISVGPGNGPAVSFSANTMTATRSENNAPMVTAEISNTGGRALDVTGSLTLDKGPGGISAGPIPLTKTVTVSPGGSARVAVELDGSLPEGPWDATLTLSSGNTVQEISETLTFPETDTETGRTIPKSTVTLFAVALVGLLICSAAVYILRRP